MDAIRKLSSYARLRRMYYITAFVVFIGLSSWTCLQYPYLFFVILFPCDKPSDARIVTQALTADFPTYNLSDWMSTLPAAKGRLPLNMLAIPGSHNSGTSYLPLAITLSPTASRAISHYRPVWSLVKNHVLRWDMTQTLSFTGQLKLGVRYFDVRPCFNEKTGDFHFYHTLYYGSITEGLNEINEFLLRHPKEIVLLDVKKSCDMKNETHAILIHIFFEIFNSKLCANMDIRYLTLEYLWKNKKQVVLFYRDKFVNENNSWLYKGQSVISPWAETSNLTDLLRFLSDNLSNDNVTQPFTNFYVHQALLTTDVPYIRANPCNSIRDLALDANRAFVAWIKSQKAANRTVTICMADFVELFDFVPAVVGLNY